MQMVEIGESQEGVPIWVFVLTKVKPITTGNTEYISCLRYQAVAATETVSVNVRWPSVCAHKPRQSYSDQNRQYPERE